jgi:hypothetical protein
VARVAVVGAGAVGTAMAAAIQQAGGHDLVLCVRRPVGGLSLQSSDGWTIDIAAPVVTEPDRLTPADWVLLAVKAYQTRGTEGWLRILCGAETTVVVLQNGIEQRESVRGLVRDSAVVPAVVWLNLDRAPGGCVQHIAGHNVLVPDEPRGHAFAELLADLEAASGRRLLTITGGYLSASQAAPPVRGVLTAARAHGLAHDCLTPAEVAARFPGFCLTDDWSRSMRPTPASSSKRPVSRPISSWRWSTAPRCTTRSRFDGGSPMARAFAWRPSTAPTRRSSSS